MRWRAWYADGASVDSDSATWHDLPADGLVVLKVWPDDGPKQLFCGHDAIWWDGEGETFQLDLPKPFARRAAREARAGRLKYGRLIPNEDYERIYAEALAAQG